MKRDMDLARTILEQVEEKSEGIGIVTLDIQDHSKEEIAYHVMLLNQAGFLKAVDNLSQWGMAWVPSSLTWEGHEFLDAIRNDTVWEKIKDEAIRHGGNLPFEVIKGLAVKLAATLVGLG